MRIPYLAARREREGRDADAESDRRRAGVHDARRAGIEIEKLPGANHHGPPVKAVADLPVQDQLQRRRRGGDDAVPRRQAGQDQLARGRDLRAVRPVDMMIHDRETTAHVPPRVLGLYYTRPCEK